MKIIPVIFDNLFGPRADKSWRLTFSTQELSPDDKKVLHEFAGEFCYLAIKKEDFKQDEKDLIETLKTDFDSPGKTPSQRLRGVFYRLWEKKPEGYKDFNLYYDFKMNLVIEHYKTLIDP